MFSVFSIFCVKPFCVLFLWLFIFVSAMSLRRRTILRSYLLHTCGPRATTKHYRLVSKFWSISREKIVRIRQMEWIYRKSRQSTSLLGFRFSLTRSYSQKLSRCLRSCLCFKPSQSSGSSNTKNTTI